MTIENDSRAQIAAFLPEAIAKALNSYHGFVTRGAEDDGDAKVFAAHHTACKVAVAHIELLLKLARWADMPDGAAEGGEQAILAAMMREAEEELSKYKGIE